MHCERCGSNLRRLTRRGFLQKKVFAWFGYYPWECPICREVLILKKQHQRRTRQAHESNAD